MADHGDKRSVSTDALETLGTIIGEGQGRDAIHLAVEPAVAAVALSPGEDVGFVPGGVGPCEHNIGIVDPFLKAPVLPGERFWLVIYPRKITSLRHVWTHPDIPSPEDRANAALVADALMGSHINWIKGFAESVGLSYQMIMEGARGKIEHDDYLSFGGLLEGESVPDAFWDHYEAVIGHVVPDKKKGNFFSCSC